MKTRTSQNRQAQPCAIVHVRVNPAEYADVERKIAVRAIVDSLEAAEREIERLNAVHANVDGHFEIWPAPTAPVKTQQHPAKSQVTWRALTTSFCLEGHIVEIYLHGWSGLEIYSVDGCEKLRIRKFGPWGARRFCLTHHDRRTVEIHFNRFPIGLGSVYFDGQIVVEEIFPGWLRTLLVTTLVFIGVGLGGVALLAGVIASNSM